MIKLRIQGFTIIEILVAIVVIALLAAIALPRMTDLSSSARVATLESIAGTMRSTIVLVKSKAKLQGLSVVPTNPGGSAQTQFIVDFNGQTSEVDWRNLCPESIAELGNRMTMIDFINLETGSGLTSQINNQYTLVGFDIPGFSVPTNRGCYVIYDSFGFPDCTVTTVTADC